MELFIRSQDKTMLYKVNEIFVESEIINYIETGKYFICVNDEGFGTYKSKERALEVLDEIQRILKPAIKALTPLTESKEDYKNHCMKTELVGYETTYDIVALPTYVYEMPSE